MADMASETPSGDFITALTESSIQLHEWYVSLCSAGFTEHEAITLMVSIIRGQLQ